MRISINECVHCGVEYRFQWSGPSMPGEYNDHDHCPECKKAIVDALNAIPKKFGYKFVVTTEVSIHTILGWEQENKEDRQKKDAEAQKNDVIIFPMIRRVFSSMMNANTGEISISGAISGRGEFEGRSYHYFYWPSKIDEAKISVEKLVNLQTDEELSYRIKQ